MPLGVWSGSSDQVSALEADAAFGMLLGALLPIVACTRFRCLKSWNAVLLITAHTFTTLFKTDEPVTVMQPTLW